MSPPVYRYDPADFTDGQVITSRGDHITGLTGKERVVELALRNSSPRMAEIRSTSLYVWRGKETAEFLWRNTRKGEHLYELDIDVDDIQHIGDVAIYSLATGIGPQELAIDALVRQYWNRTICKSAVEILVSKAIVRQKLFDNSQK